VRRCHWRVRCFWPSKTEIFVHLGRERLRNGAETADRETADFRPRSRPALLLEVINDRGELHCHRIRHRGGRALPVPGCPQGRFPRRSTLKGYESVNFCLRRARPEIRRPWTCSRSHTYMHHSNPQYDLWWPQNDFRGSIRASIRANGGCTDILKLAKYETSGNPYVIQS
jgi:hypothetical protein